MFTVKDYFNMTLVINQEPISLFFYVHKYAWLKGSNQLLKLVLISTKKVLLLHCRSGVILVLYNLKMVLL